MAVGLIVGSFKLALWLYNLSYAKLVCFRVNIQHTDNLLQHAHVKKCSIAIFILPAKLMANWVI